MLSVAGLERGAVVALEMVNVDEYPAAEIPCLRCGELASLRFAGPCERCTIELRERFSGEAREIDSEYVPKMNVTPNAVALPGE